MTMTDKPGCAIWVDGPLDGDDYTTTYLDDDDTATEAPAPTTAPASSSTDDGEDDASVDTTAMSPIELYDYLDSEGGSITDSVKKRMAAGGAFNEKDIESMCQRMNEHHAVVAIGSSVKYSAPGIDNMGNTTMQFYSSAAMNALYASTVFNSQTLKMEMEHRYSKGKPYNLFTVWNEWAGRRVARGVGCWPSGHGKPDAAPKGVLNTWTGFAAAPVEGDWSLYKNHLLEIVCCGDRAKFEWLMDWMADIVQDPGNKKGTAVILRSTEEGSGKSMVGVFLAMMIGRHAVRVTKSDHVVGKFNSHLSEAILAIIEEAIWAGDKSAEGTLKSLITENEIMCERKGIDAVMARSYLRALFTSNEVGQYRQVHIRGATSSSMSIRVMPRKSAARNRARRTSPRSGIRCSFTAASMRCSTSL